MIASLAQHLDLPHEIVAAGERAFARVATLTYPAQQRARANVFAAFSQANIAESDLHGAIGYGYDDAARQAYERVLASILGAERALARFSLVSGTHAIVTALAACTPRGTTLVSVTGRPYDTLRNAIVDHPESLVARGISYRECALREDGEIDSDAVIDALGSENIGAIFLQRSRGYATRPSVRIASIDALVRRVRQCGSAVPILVDNCYGELVEEREPTHVGANLVMGSLIKNLGGSIAPGGAYVAGDADLIERVAHFHYAPGLGSALGPTFGLGRLLIQGLFLAPLIVEQTLRGLDFAASLFADLGYRVDPLAGAARTDIVQAIRLGSPERLLAFARGLQRVMPINARFAPEPGPVPGYRDPVVMSGGAFVGGATIELSCDAPLREPHEVYLQGGVIAEQSYIGVLAAAAALRAAG
ncbi:MAG: methionine gamma-lyase family protein [Vulcanimicrobiaceae bacterium]